MFLQWVLYTDLKKKIVVYRRSMSVSGMLGKLTFMFWEGTGKQICILRDLIALGSKAFFFFLEGGEEDTERPHKRVIIWYEQWKCLNPTTESVDTKEPNIPQATGRSAGGWSSKECRSVQLQISFRPSTPYEPWLPDLSSVGLGLRSILTVEWITGNGEGF